MLKQQQTIQQTQKLSPQQMQVIRMLELPVVELEERVKQELQDNPTLEEMPQESVVEHNLSTEEISLGDYRSEDDIPDYKLQSTRREQQERQPEITYSRSNTFFEHLEEQLALRDMPEDVRELAHYLIGNLDSNGYLTRSLQAIDDDLLITTGHEIPRALLTEALGQIQELDPAGVGASSLQECLLLQLERKRATPATDLAYRLVDHAFEAVSKRHYELLQRQFEIDEPTLKAALNEITHLNPKPGSAYGDPLESKMEQIVPDFIVENIDGELHLTLNNGNIPTLHVSDTYQAMFADYNQSGEQQRASQRQAVLYIKQKIDAARAFINAVTMRNQTLEATMRCILKQQHAFFLTGDESKLRPMILKDVADPTGYDISTISRVSNSKYVQTDFGIFPLKFFFSDGTQNQEGETISTREVKKILSELIQHENKQKPLSDDKLCEQLTQRGYTIARRTVAKYREQLEIPVARLRKEI